MSLVCCEGASVYLSSSVSRISDTVHLTDIKRQSHVIFEMIFGVNIKFMNIKKTNLTYLKNLNQFGPESFCGATASCW